MAIADVHELSWKPEFKGQLPSALCLDRSQSTPLFMVLESYSSAVVARAKAANDETSVVLSLLL
jgi:hypothetical protein